jgi:hypothetical protein
LFIRPSWKISTGLDTLDHNHCRFCRFGTSSGGIGVAAESAWLKREVYFGFGELETEYGRVFESGYRIGGGATLGTLIDVTQRWKVSLAATFLNFPIGERSHEWRFSGQQRLTLTRNLALRWDFNQRDNKQEYLLNLQAFF